MFLGLGLSICQARAEGTVLTSLNYSQADTAGGESITITGTGLDSASSCTVGGTSATITANTSTTLTFTTPAKAAGTYDVVVTTARGASNALSLVTWAPSELSLTLFNRASFSASPWAGTASAGVSGTKSLTEATNPPSVGSAVNSLTPADFDGTNDILNLSGTLATYATASAYSGWALVYVDAISTNAASSFDNDAILSTTGGAAVAIYLKSTGVVGFRHFGGTSGELALTRTFTTGTWQLVQWKYDGTNAKLRVNGGTRGSVAPDALAATTNPVAIGQNYAGAQFLDGKILEIGLTNTAISDANEDKILAYARTRYTQALT